MIVGVPRECAPGERRVALVPDAVRTLASDKLEIVIQTGAGVDAGFPDDEYRKAGAAIEADAGALLRRAEVVLKVQPPASDEVASLRAGAVLIGLAR